MNVRNTPSRSQAVMEVIEERPSKKQTGWVVPASPQRNFRHEDSLLKYSSLEGKKILLCRSKMPKIYTPTLQNY